MNLFTHQNFVIIQCSHNITHENYIKSKGFLLKQEVSTQKNFLKELWISGVNQQLGLHGMISQQKEPRFKNKRIVLNKWTQCYEVAARFDPGFKNRRIFLQQINKPAARFEEKKINSEHKSYEAANQNVLFTLIPKMRTYLDALMLNIRFSWILEINNSIDNLNLSTTGSL